LVHKAQLAAQAQQAQQAKPERLAIWASPARKAFKDLTDKQDRWVQLEIQERSVPLEN
jgi:hypothetical protein